LALLDKRKRANDRNEIPSKECGGDGSAAFDGAQGATYKATVKQTKTMLSRGGVVTATSATGAPVVSLVCGHGHGERMVSHWTVFVIAMLMGAQLGGATYSVFSLDVACIFETWRVNQDRRADIAHAALLQAIPTAVEKGVSLSSLDPKNFPDWYNEILTNCATALNTDATNCSAPILSLDNGEVHRVLCAFVVVLEVYCKVDTATAPVDTFPKLSMGDIGRVMLNLLHALTHGIHCRHVYAVNALYGVGLYCGEQVERYNEMLNALCSRVASATLAHAKMYIAALQRHVAADKVDALPRIIVRGITRARVSVVPAALHLVLCVTKLRDAIPVGVSTSISDLFKRLAASAADANEKRQEHEWAVHDRVRDDLASFESWHVERLKKSTGKKPSKRALLELLRMLVVGRTRPELICALKAVDSAVGEDQLAAETAREAIQLSITLPDIGAAENGNTISKFVEMFEWPTALLQNDDDDGDDDGDRNDGELNAASVTNLVHWAAMCVAANELSVLSANIRENRVGVIGGGARLRTAGGGGKRGAAHKEAASEHKQKKALLFKWMKRYNIVIDLLTKSIVAWVARCPLVAPPMCVDELPSHITDEQRLSTSWTPEDVGVARVVRVSASVVDAFRLYRTTWEEAATVGPDRVRKMQIYLRDRVQALEQQAAACVNLVKFLDASPSKPKFTAVHTLALGDVNHATLLRRHLPHTMLVPANLPTVSDQELGSLSIRGVIAGHQAAVAYEYAAALGRVARADLQFDPIGFDGIPPLPMSDEADQSDGGESDDADDVDDDNEDAGVV
jgi:hypothetical protein